MNEKAAGRIKPADYGGNNEGRISYSTGKLGLYH